MIQPQGIIGLEEDVTVPEAVKAMDALAQEYMQYFNTNFVTIHIMRCLIEVVCPEAIPDAKHMALQKVEELHSEAHSWHVADILRTLLGSAGVSVRSVLLRCGAEIQRLRIQIAREPARVHTLRVRESQSMGNAESDALRNTRELQASREKLNTYTHRIEALEDELRHMRPSYDRSDKFRASRIGAVIYGTTTPSTDNRDSSETVRKDKKTKDGIVVSKKNDSGEIANGYNPSREFVMQAARQLFAESRVSRKEVVQGDLNPTQPLNGEQQVLQKQEKHEEEKPLLVGKEGIRSLETSKNTNVKKYESSNDMAMHKYPLMTPPVSYFLPFKYHALSNLCDTLPPTSESISAEAFHALMTDKRPLCVQEKERADREKSWNQVGKIRLATADEITGPYAYTRQDGARYLIQMEKELTRMLWNK